MPIQREKAEQAHIVQLLRSIGGAVYVLGTRRRRGDHQGTMQTPGLPDVIAFLPTREHACIRLVVDGVSLPLKRLFVCVECKATGGRLRPEQRAFRDFCRDAGIQHVSGDFDAIIAWLIDFGYVQADQFPHYRQPHAAAARA
jgi:hypothetical protein